MLLVDAALEGGRLGGRVELLEPLGEQVAVGSVRGLIRYKQGSAIQMLEGYQRRAIVLIAQLLRYMQTIVGINADQVGGEGCAMDLRQRQAVRNVEHAGAFVRFGDDARGVEQPPVGQAGQGAPSAIGRDDGFLEDRLMKPPTRRTERVSTLVGVGQVVSVAHWSAECVPSQSAVRVAKSRKRHAPSGNWRSNRR